MKNKINDKTMRSAKILSDGIGEINEKWILMADDPGELRSAVIGAERNRKKKNSNFVAYEIKKLFGVKYLWVFLAVLIVLNSAIAWYTAGQTAAAREPSDMIAQFFLDYFEDPEALDVHYDEILAFNDEQNKLFMEAMRAGNYNFTPETLPNVYSTDENYSDSELFSKLYSALEAARDYPAVIQTVIDSAAANLSEFAAMGIGEDSFTYKYQLRVIHLYELARDNVKISVEYTRGWDEYFDYDIVNVFLSFMVIMLGTLIFAQEKQNGFVPIIRTAKNGRLRTAIAKILTMLLLSCVFVLMFTFSTWAVYGARIGFSSPSNVIQALDTFTLSPYQITIGQYFAVTVGVRLLTFAVFSMIILAFSALFCNYVLIYMSGLGFYGLNYLLYTLRYINASSPAKNLNFVAAAAVNPLFVRYRAVNIFGETAGYVPFMLCVFGILFIGCAVLTAVTYVRGVREIRPRWIDAVLSAVMTKYAEIKNLVKSFSARRHTNSSGRRLRAYSMSLTTAEVFKTLISSRFIIIVALLLCVKIWYSADVYKAGNSYADSVYKEYMTALEGPVTAEKLEYLAEERAMINEIISMKNEVEQDYIAEKITFEEYREFLSDYNYAYSRNDLLTRIEEHAEYLAEKKTETGIDGWFIYDTGWKKLYSCDADLFLYTAVLILLTGTFASEYASRSSSGGFAQILRSTKNGREKTFSAKLLSAGVIAVTVSLVMAAVDIISVFINYDMPAGSAPLLSMQYFGAISAELSVGAYLVLFVLLRVVGALLMAMLVCALSELLCKYIPVLGSAVVLTLLPALVSAFGFSAANRINFLNLLAGTPLVLESAGMSMLGSGWTMLALWITVAGAAVGAMMLSAKRMFVR